MCEIEHNFLFAYGIFSREAVMLLTIWLANFSLGVGILLALLLVGAEVVCVLFRHRILETQVRTDVSFASETCQNCGKTDLLAEVSGKNNVRKL
jgi:hypothetical protein